MLEWEVTLFPQIATALQLKEPYVTLWKTAAEYYEKYDRWMNGPFITLDADKVNEDVGNMWRTMHKLSRTFADVPNPKHSIDHFKHNLDTFKENLPLLTIFCNPGIRDRHWKRMSAIVGFELKPRPDTPLSTMMKYNLGRFLTE